MFNAMTQCVLELAKSLYLGLQQKAIKVPT